MPGKKKLWRHQNVPRFGKRNRFGEDIVVQKTGVDGEETHEDDDVATAKHGVPNLPTVSEGESKSKDYAKAKTVLRRTSPPALKFLSFSSL